MNNKSNAAAIISYLTWIGFIIALCVRDKTDEFTTHHLNQALIINILSIIAGVVSSLPVIGVVAGIIDFAVVVLWIMGIYRAITWKMDPLPLIGDIRIIK